MRKHGQDALSRKVHTPELSVSAISVSQPAWLQEMVSGYESDEEAKCLLAALSIDKGAKANFSLVDGLIRYKNRIWVGNNLELHR